MALNPQIILSGQQPDIVNALDRGNVAGQRNIEFGRQNALNSLYQAQGPQIAQGEQSALNALSRFDPIASLGVHQTRLGMDATRLGMDATRQSMSQNDQNMQIALEEHAASLSAAEREQQRMDIENDLAVLMTAQTPQQWDQMAEQTGNPNMVGQFDNREAAIAPFIGLKEVLDRQSGGDPTSAMQNFDFMVSQGMDPEQAMERAFSGGPTINNNMGSDVGTIPPGYELFTDPATGARSMRLIEGSPQALEAQALEDKAEDRSVRVNRAGSTVIQDLTRARNLIDELGALSSGEGVLGGIARTQSARVPGTVANRITQFTESALSNVGLDTLQQMRDDSPTGGALGQVPIQQQQRLEQVLGSLQINQPPDVLEANIKRVQNIYTDIMHGTSQERAAAVARGDLSPEENAQIESFYFALPFDERGNPISGVQQTQGGGQSAGSSIPPLPQGIDVTPEEWPQIWEKMSDEDKALFQ